MSRLFKRVASIVIGEEQISAEAKTTAEQQRIAGATSKKYWHKEEALGKASKFGSARVALELSNADAMIAAANATLNPRSGDARVIEGLRISFKVDRDVKPAPNPASITIYNLSEETRAELKGKYFKISLTAGYTDASGVIFSGDVRTFSHEKTESEWVTKIQAGDGAHPIQYARVSNSYKPGVGVFDVITGTVKAMAIDPGNALTTLKTAVTGQFASGYVQHGQAATELNTLLKDQGFEWSLQDGRLEVLRPLEVQKGSIPLISGESGLIGTPELGSPTEKNKPQILKVKSLLLTELRPGQAFQLNSLAHKGTYKARKVSHQGDTHGGDWVTEIEAVKYDGGAL